MLDTHARKYVNPIIELGAKFLLRLKLTPNNVTILALLLGISTSIFFIIFDMQIIAVTLLWGIRIFRCSRWSYGKKK